MRIRFQLMGAVFSLLFLMSVASTARPQAPHLQVAAAADLRFAMDELARRFETKTGTKVDVTYGSSGNFLAQLLNGAPFDIFFSADVNYPQQIESAGLAVPRTLREYATGRIVIWMPAEAKTDLATDGWNALLGSSVQRIAIANPNQAPYGRAAMSALRSAGIYERVREKLVYGENIAQAAQFVQSGNAQAGIVALSLALSPAMKDGKRWLIPFDTAPPVRQAAVILANAKNKVQARAFFDWVTSKEGQAVFEQFGFGPPVSNAPTSRRR